MAKRLTDTCIWDKAWFRKLPPRLKEAFRFLCEKCNHAGIWDVDMETMSYMVGEEITESDLTHYLGDHLLFFEDKIFIKGFIEFQYSKAPSQLNPNNKVHKSAMDIMARYEVLRPMLSPLEEPPIGSKDKDKDKEKEKERTSLVNNNYRSSPLSVLFDHMPEVQTWLDQGNHDTHLLALKRFSESLLLEEIPKMFSWAVSKGGVRAEAWLISRLSNAQGTSELPPKLAHKPFSGFHTINPLTPEEIELLKAAGEL